MGKSPKPQTPFARFGRIFPVAVGAVVWAALSGAPSAEEAPKKDKPAPVSVVSVEELQDTLETARGKPAVVNLWATWCPPCVKETPELAKFYREYKGKAAFLSVSLDDPSVAEDDTMSKFVEKHKVPFPVRILRSGDPDDVSKALKTEIVGALPVTVVYDADGKVVKKWEGEVTSADLKEAVEPLLKKDKAADDPA